MSSEKSKWHAETRLYNEGDSEPYMVTTISVMAKDPDDACHEAGKDAQGILELNNPSGSYRFLSIRKAHQKPAREPGEDLDEIDEDCAGA